ncbi:hypothetical protein F5887DRAFT_1081644 [Amanita rubescens]|nr:hypothetical protein F5887DRAFT_1081644 [Amanita rubescens]
MSPIQAAGANTFKPPTHDDSITELSSGDASQGPSVPAGAQELAEELKGYIVGPVPVQTFLNLYVPQVEHDMTVFDKESAEHFQRKMRESKSEKSMVKMWVGALPLSIVVSLDQIPSVIEMEKFCPDLKPCNVHAKETTVFYNIGIKPNIILHRGKHQAMRFVELMGEVKTKKSSDPFVDENAESIEAYTVEGIKTRVKSPPIPPVILVYSTVPTAGVVVTQKIPLADQNLAQFFWCFNHMSKSKQGWDKKVAGTAGAERSDAWIAFELQKYISVSYRSGKGMPSEEEKEKKVKELKSIVPSTETLPYLKASIGGVEVIIGDIIHAAVYSPLGRATRTFKAYFIAENRTVLLKSTWRVIDQSRRREHEVYDAPHQQNGGHYTPPPLPIGFL